MKNESAELLSNVSVSPNPSSFFWNIVSATGPMAIRAGISLGLRAAGYQLPGLGAGPTGASCPTNQFQNTATGPSGIFRR